MEEKLIRIPKAQARAPLTTGILRQDGQTLWLTPAAVFEDEILFKCAPVETVPGRNSISAWLSSFRAISLTATGAPFFMVLFYGLGKSWSGNLGIGFLSLISVLGFQIAINLLNDFEDHVRLVDLPGTFGGAGVIQRGLLSPIHVRNAAFAFLGLSFLFAIPCLIEHPKLTASLGLLGLLGVLGYSGKPFDFKYKALGDLVVFILCGPALTTGFSWMLFGKVDSGIFLVGISMGAAATGILHANNMADIVPDTRAGAKTLASVLGFHRSRLYLAALLAISYASLIYGTVTGDFTSLLPVGLIFSSPGAAVIIQRAYL
ncbi:MAG: prenyltransferase, partial [Bdellovibrionales bacterium]|nr:prenyltransferase [Bdellovibrionales bacterium]